MKTKFKIGLDIHGVVDAYPLIFKMLSEEWIAQGHEVYIITGQEWKDALPKIQEIGIQYTDHFSIVDFHRQLGTPMHTRSDKNGFWMEKNIWIRSKGDYATEIGLDLHFDDYAGYAEYFPPTCTYVIVPPKNFDKCYPKYYNRR